MSRPSNILISSIFRNQRQSGPTSSAQINDFQNEVIRDLAIFQQEWNTKIVPLHILLPDGTDDSTVNAFTNGLDGRTLYVNAEATSTLSSGKYFNSIKDRPNTSYEQFVNLYTYIDDLIADLQESINVDIDGLTSDQKSRIGINIFDTNQTSLTSSLDGKSLIHTGNILQIARDLYGEDNPTLNSNGTKVLTNSVKTIVDSLLELHSGNWEDDLELSHDSLNTSTSFRRLEFAIVNLADNDSVAFSHSSGMFPIVQVLTVDAIVGIDHSTNSVLPVYLNDGTDHPGIKIEHTSSNAISITNKLGETLVNGLVILQW